MSRKEPAHTCTVCGRSTSNEDANVCQICSTPFDDGYFDDRYQKICPQCNRIQPMFSAFCQYCGRAFEKNLKNTITFIGNQILGGICMFKSKVTLLIMAIVCALVLVLFFAPLARLGISGIFSLVALGLLVISFLIAFLAQFPKSTISKVIYQTGVYVGAIVLVFALIVGFALPYTSTINATKATTANPTTAATTVANTTATTATPTTAATSATPAATNPVSVTKVNNGIYMDSMTWKFFKAGTLISGDVSLYKGDNKGQKITLTDGIEETADFVYLTKDCYIWSEFGCYSWTPEQANIETITHYINDKFNDLPKVRFFRFNGSNTDVSSDPTTVIYTEKITIDVITARVAEFNK